MADTKNLLPLLSITLLLLAASISTVQSTADFDPTVMSLFTSRSACKGTVGECLGGGEEFELDSEINRRILATSNYISYAALNRNRVPCSRRGASYYNCRPGAQANPYSRGCSAITRCARR